MTVANRKNRTDRTSPVGVLSVRWVNHAPKTGRTGHTPLGVSVCPVRAGTPDTITVGQSHIPPSVEWVPLADRKPAGGAERDGSMLENDSQLAMTPLNKKWNGR